MRLDEIAPTIIGLAKGYEEALEIIEQIVNEVYQETGTAEIRTWLEARIEKMEGRRKGVGHDVDTILFWYFLR